MFVLTFLCPILSFSQHTFDSCHWIFNNYLSLGSARAGLGVGNAAVYTGIRINALNYKVKRTNILDISVCDRLEWMGPPATHVANGISLCASISVLEKNNGISAACLAEVALHENGIAVAPFVLSEKINGLGVAALGMIDTLNGLSLSLVTKGIFPDTAQLISRVNGVAIAAIAIRLGKIHGMTIAPINRTDCHNGLSVGVYNEADKQNGMQLGLLNISAAQNGVSIGICNQTNKLKGVQFGLINIVENNPKGFRMLPFFNMHLRS